jgi:hypothetical protein
MQIVFGEQRKLYRDCLTRWIWLLMTCMVTSRPEKIGDGSILEEKKNLGASLVLYCKRVLLAVILCLKLTNHIYH